MVRFNIVSGELETERDRPGFRIRTTRVGDRIGGDKIGATVYELDDGQRMCPYHFHYGVEEWAYVIDGTPTLRTPGGERTLRPGDLVCFPPGPAGAHSVAGPGRMMMLSANREPSISAYPDSDKLGSRPSGDPEPDRLNFRRSDAVDYWQGEA